MDLLWFDKLFAEELDFVLKNNIYIAIQLNSFDFKMKMDFYKFACVQKEAMESPNASQSSQFPGAGSMLHCIAVRQGRLLPLKW